MLGENPDLHGWIYRITQMDICHLIKLEIITIEIIIIN